MLNKHYLLLNVYSVFLFHYSPEVIDFDLFSNEGVDLNFLDDRCLLERELFLRCVNTLPDVFILSNDLRGLCLSDI